ncbi:protelomerase family protein [Anabaena sp. WFMT]|uniref:protelomerase family protein n=1 Tax=Anabaena sp. WFMT TaxID=3449730 RepID=UPI003F2429FD
MSKAVQEEVDKLFEAVKDLHSLEEIKPHCEAFNEFINTKTTYSKDSLGTVLSRVGFYKKFKSIKLEQGKNAELVEKFDGEGNVKGHELKHYVLELCGLDKADWVERNTTTRVNDRLVNDGQEVNPETYLEVTGKLLDSNDPHELAVGLIAATGRRPHEILARAKFSPVEGQEYWVMFEGQGKKRGEKPIFKIATLYPASYVIQKLNQLRKDTRDFVKGIEAEFKGDIAAQNRTIENRRGNSLRRVVQEYFGGKETETPVLNFRDSEDQNDCKALRAAYLCLATDRDCKGSLGSKMLHAAKLAGHFTNEKPTDDDLRNLVTTLGYADYFTTKSVPFMTLKSMTIETEKKSKITILEHDLEAIRNLQKEWELPNQQSVINKLIENFNNRKEAAKQLLEANQRIAQLETKIKDLEAMETTQATVTTAIDTEALEAMIDAKVSAAVEKALQGLPVATIPAAIVPTTTTQQTAKDRNQDELQGMTNAELWASKKNGVAEEKIRRCFNAMTLYNDTIATGDNDRIAITNIALSQLSGTNRQVVGGWVEVHKDEIISHNAKYGMHNSKEPSSPTTYYNKGRDTDTIVGRIKAEILEIE